MNKKRYLHWTEYDVPNGNGKGTHDKDHKINLYYIKSICRTSEGIRICLKNGQSFEVFCSCLEIEEIDK